MRVKPDNVKLQIARSAVASLVNPEKALEAEKVDHYSSDTRIRLLIIVAVMLVCIYGIIGLPTSTAQLMDNWKKNIHLGIDLKGGSNLVMQVQMQDAFKAEADTVIQRLRDESGQSRSRSRTSAATIPRSITPTIFRSTSPACPRPRRATSGMIVNDNFGSVWIMTGVNATDYRLTLKPTEALRIRADTLTQIINTIEKKINGLRSGGIERAAARRNPQILVSCRA